MSLLRTVLPVLKQSWRLAHHASSIAALPARPNSNLAGPSTAELIMEREREIAELQSDLRAAINAGRWATAAKLSEDVLTATESHFTKNHVAYASALNNRGLVLKQTGRVEDALSAYQEAFKIYSRLVGQDHASTAASLANLGLCNLAAAEKTSGMKKLELVNVAKRCFEDAKQARERALGPGHWLTASTGVHLASALRVARQFAEAEAELLSAIESLRASVGTWHSATAGALNNLGYLYKHMGELEKAGDAYREAWDLRKGLLGASHPDTIATHFNVAELHRVMGDEAGATQMQADILKLLETEREAQTNSAKPVAR